MFMINVDRACPVLINWSIYITVLILQFIYLHGLAPISFLFFIFEKVRNKHELS